MKRLVHNILAVVLVDDHLTGLEVGQEILALLEVQDQVLNPLKSKFLVEDLLAIVLVDLVLHGLGFLLDHCVRWLRVLHDLVDFFHCLVEQLLRIFGFLVVLGFRGIESVFEQNESQQVLKPVLQISDSERMLYGLVDPEGILALMLLHD